MQKIYLYYDNSNGYIIYENKDLTVGSILAYYDDIIKIIDFEDGLLTVLMKKGNEEVEEYVDFNAALDMLNLLDDSSKYFKDVALTDIILIDRVVSEHRINKNSIVIRKILRNEIGFYEVVYTNYYKAIFTIEELQLVSTNISKECIKSIIDFVKYKFYVEQ